MKVHSTNYTNTFIAIAEDCPLINAEIPPSKEGNKSVAVMQFEMLYDNPYQYTSDDVIFNCFAMKNNIGSSDYQSEREHFYSKGQPCLRCSPLAKRYGFGFHANEEGKLAIYNVESPEYKAFLDDKNLDQIKAMKSKK